MSTKRYLIVFRGDDNTVFHDMFRSRIDSTFPWSLEISEWQFVVSAKMELVQVVSAFRMCLEDTISEHTSATGEEYGDVYWEYVFRNPDLLVIEIGSQYANFSDPEMRRYFDALMVRGTEKPESPNGPNLKPRIWD